jgi:rhodanese-related sulfurtransferase
MENQTMKITLRAFILFAVVALCIPFSLLAREVSLEQVKQNVINLHKSVMAGQPAVLAKDFKKVISSDTEFVLLDVRSEAEFKAAHLPGALHVERGRIEWIIPNIIKKSDRKIYVYCQDGRRSAFATERLHEMGYANVIHIADGFKGWVTAGYPVYNIHGEFILSPGGFDKREPTTGNIGK